MCLLIIASVRFANRLGGNVACRRKMERKYTYIVISGFVLTSCTAAQLSVLGHKARANQIEKPVVRTAAVVLAQYRPISNSLVLSGEFRPFQEVDVHAKISGYIRKIYVDVGDHIKAGETLAILEVPELS